MDNEDILGNIIGKIYLGNIDNELGRGIHHPCYILLVQMNCGLGKRITIFGNTVHGGLQILHLHIGFCLCYKNIQILFNINEELHNTNIRNRLYVVPLMALSSLWIIC